MPILLALYKFFVAEFLWIILMKTTKIGPPENSPLYGHTCMPRHISSTPLSMQYKLMLYHALYDIDLSIEIIWEVWDNEQHYWNSMSQMHINNYYVQNNAKLMSILRLSTKNLNYYLKLVLKVAPALFEYYLASI